ncbi:MAG: ABC transporter ATP-binding protein [Betaproteobacteria bacterium]
MSQAVLQVQALQRRFGLAQILRGVDLELAAGECLAVIGPNGAGKSTLFNVISGALAPSAGDVRLHGRSIAGRPPHAIARLGLARSFQVSQLFEQLSVAEHLRLACLPALGLRADGWRGLRGVLAGLPAVQAALAHWLERLGLSEQQNCLPAQLSYAQQRMLELGLTLAGEPQVVLLDEPTAGMSRSETEEFVQRLRSLTMGRALMLVEHDMQVVFELADRVAVLHEGRMLACGTPAQVRADEAVRSIYLGGLAC